MIDQNQTTSINSAIKDSKSVLVVLSPRINFDGVAAALSLFLSLEKSGKQVNIVSSEAMTVKYSSLIGVNRVGNKIGGRNLIVSFDYTEESIEKVSYQIENSKFNLMIQPKEGFKPLNAEQVEYSYAGGNADCVFIFGFNSLEELGKLYQDNRAMFDQEKVFKFTYNPSSSFSEEISRLIHNLQLSIDPDIASNLMSGIERSTRGFDPALASADTFEMAAFLLRSGGQRQNRVSLNQSTQLKRKEPGKPVTLSTPVEQTTDEPEAPPEWLEPKIYKSNTRS